MLVSIEVKDKNISIIDEKQDLTFKELGLVETDLEEFLRKNIEVICDDEESLLIIGQQVKNTSNGRSDLTALDDQGNIVLVEIKRDKEDIKGRKEPFEFQAIRYAASYAKIADTDTLIDKIYAPYIEKYKDEYSLGQLIPYEKAARILQEFLEKNYATQSFNKKQRIKLVASDFDEQTLSAVSWLISNNVDISCYKITPVKIHGILNLEIDRILPVEKLSDYYVDIKDVDVKSPVSTNRKTPRRDLPRMDKILEWGIIKKGDRLCIKNYDDSEATVIDAVNVEYKGEKFRYNEWGLKITGWSAICIYEWVKIVGQEKTLDQLRKERLQIEKEKAEQME